MKKTIPLMVVNTILIISKNNNKTSNNACKQDRSRDNHKKRVRVRDELLINPQLKGQFFNISNDLDIPSEVEDVRKANGNNGAHKNGNRVENNKRFFHE